jgi:peptidoglycan/xylan/chitin deacetylase (PgdA/CDA1 family)
MSQETPEGSIEQRAPEVRLPRRGRGRLTAAFSAAVLVLAIVYLVAGPVPVRVDGALSFVRRGTTVGDLLQQGRMSREYSNLRSLSGRLLKIREGAPPRITVDGAVAESATVVGAGSQVTAYRAADITEGVATRTVEATQAVRYIGTGPVMNIEQSGTPASIEVVVGAVSGEEVSSRLVSRGTAMTVRREPAWPGAREVALTFDDGPWPGSTDAILAELVSADVKATFFVVGKQLSARPEVSRRVVAAGMEIGDHSHSHKMLARVPHATITNEILFGQQAIKRELGVTPLWFRPPGGSTNSFVYSEAQRLGMRVVLWSIDPKDWRTPPARVIASRVLDRVRPGSVILMHDGGGDRSHTVAALGFIIRGLKARGYAMVTLSRLYRIPEPVVTP